MLTYLAPRSTSLAWPAPAWRPAAVLRPRPAGSDRSAGSDRPAGDERLAAPLAGFAPIQLTEMQSVALLDRVEVKYLMRLDTLLQVLPQLSATYRVLEVKGQRINHYRTLYFDTADFALYRSHHAGARNRYKVRAREYVESQCSFLEVKHKVNKQRTVKSRIPTTHLVTQLGDESASFVHEHCPYAADELAPTLWNHYTRITLVNEAGGERLTLDTNLAFAWEGRQARLPGIVVAEVKQQNGAHASDFVPLMREHHIRSGGFSKYCIGVSLLYPEVKHNRFKPVHLRLAKLAQGSHHVAH